MLNGKARCWRLLLSWLVSGVAYAATDRYDYDALGRLIRWVDEAGQVTDYAYDAADNILTVQAQSQGIPMSVVAIAPASVRRGDTRDIRIMGSSLVGARLTVPSQGLRVSGFAASSETATFRLAVSDTAELGSQTFILGNALGQAPVTLRIDPVLPVLSVSPLPLAIPPDGVERGFALTLSNADTIDHMVALASSNNDIARVSPASVIIHAGETKATARIAGYKTGTGALKLSSSDLIETAVPVFVTGDFTGVNTSRAALVGVTFEAAAASPASTFVGPLVSPSIGISRGNVLTGLTPKVLVQGQGPTDLLVSGNVLNQVSGVQIIPSDGLVLGPVNVSPDGSSLALPVTVAPTATPG